MQDNSVKITRGDYRVINGKIHVWTGKIFQEFQPNNIDVDTNKYIQTLLVDAYERGFREGGHAMLNATIQTLSKDWLFNILIRIAPKWIITGIAEKY
jgi:hypothetical protein